MSESGREPLGNPLLEQVHAGMLVLDRENQPVGTVDGVYLGVTDEQAGKKASKVPGTGATGLPVDEPLPRDVPPPVDMEDHGLKAMLEDLPLRRGYVRVAAQEPSENKRFVGAEQIDRVDDERVFLKILGSELAAS